MSGGDMVLGALAPVFLLILLGHLFARRGFPGDAFWAPAERLTYFVLFPALLVGNLAVAPLEGTALGPLALALAGAVLLATLALLLARPLFGVDGAGFTSVVQGGIRFNTYVGLAAAHALYGAAGVTVAAVALAVLVPLVNVICVGVLSRDGRATGVKPPGVLRALLGNPLILACVGGALLNVTGIGLPWGSGDVLAILGRAALPLGLLAVGAGLNVAAVRGRGRAVLLTSAFKLVALPALVAGATALLALPPLESAIAVLFAALPGATSAYILARQMGGDAELIAAMLTFQTVAAVLTLPAWLAWLAWLG